MRSKNDCAGCAERFCQPQCLPRSRLDFTFEMVNIDERLHRIFSAKILSVSLSAISAGVSPVMISTAVSRVGGAISSVRLTTASGALTPRSPSDQTGIVALEALRMPMNDG